MYNAQLWGTNTRAKMASEAREPMCFVPANAVSANSCLLAVISHSALVSSALLKHYDSFARPARIWSLFPDMGLSMFDLSKTLALT